MGGPEEGGLGVSLHPRPSASLGRARSVLGALLPAGLEKSVWLVALGVLPLYTPRRTAGQGSEFYMNARASV